MKHPEEVKALRLKIDTVINTINALPEKSRETSLAYTWAQDSKMMLGRVLKEMNQANPYPESRNPDSPVIEKMADHTNETLPIAAGADLIAIVKTLRAECEKIETELLPCVTNGVYYRESWMSITRAQLWLGMELNRIHEKKK